MIWRFKELPMREARILSEIRAEGCLLLGVKIRMYAYIVLFHIGVFFCMSLLAVGSNQ